MPDKGKVMSQAFYEKQSKLINLYQESFARKEMNVKEAVTALRMIGFSETVAAKRVSGWSVQINEQAPETDKEKKRRLKERDSLEKYMLRMILGKKFYLRLKYKQKELTKDETVKKLTRSGYTEEIAKSIVDGWEEEKW